MPKINLRRRHVAIAGGLALSLGGLALPASAQQKLQIAGNFATEHPSSVAVEQVFKKEIARLTNNQLQVDVFPAMQLGGAKENVDQVRSGTILMTWVGAAFLTGFVPELEVLSLPFLFTDRQTAFSVVDGPVGRRLDQKLKEKGFVSLGYMELGFRNVTNNVRPIRSVADLRGLKIRMQPNETHLASFRALGANPVAMDVKELYSALQQGVVDGQENPYAVILQNNFQEVQKYLSNSGHFFDVIAVVANERAFEGLKPEFQKAIRMAMANAVAAQRKAAAEADSVALSKLRSSGMTYTSLTPTQIAEFRRAVAPVYDQIETRIGKDLVQAVVAAAR